MSHLTRRGFLPRLGMIVGAAAGALTLKGRSEAKASSLAADAQTASAPSKRNFKAIDFSINAWFPGGIGARFSGIGIPEMGVCNTSQAWWGLPYSKNRKEETIKGWSPEFILERFDVAGVEKGALLACWAREGLGGKDCRVEADEVHAVVNKYPTRFFGIVGVSTLPQKGDKYYPPDYIRYAVTQLGFKGVHCYPHWFGIKVNDKRMYPIYETCSELDVPFLFQIGTGTGMSRSRICALPEWVDDVARDFPTLKITGIHPGGSYTPHWLDMLRKDENIYWGLDAGQPKMWPQWGIPEVLKENRGPGYEKYHQNLQDKIMWGTDFPVQDWALSLEQFDQLMLPEDIARKVLRDNAIRHFKLS